MSVKKEKKYIYLLIRYFNKSTFELNQEYVKLNESEYETLKLRIMTSCISESFENKSFNDSLKREANIYNKLKNLIGKNEYSILQICKFEFKDNFNKKDIPYQIALFLARNMKTDIDEYDTNDFYYLISNTNSSTTE